MQSFLNDTNYDYYIIYPPVFLQDYHIWWDRRLQNQPLSLQYTCLLAIVCACCFQHLDPVRAKELEEELGGDIDGLCENLHAAMRELASVIPAGHYHMLNVQRLLHSCYSYKFDAKFLEAWHVLSAAALEAKELGYHRDPPAGAVSEFDLELQRRLWCVVDTWDWQMSSGLGRPKIVDREDCTAKLPKLTLEGHAVSPLLHMKMQSALSRQLAAKFSAPKNIIDPPQIQEYKTIIEAWVDQFPPEYHWTNPDTSNDDTCMWLFSHRYYVHTMACLLMLNPVRHYMVKPYSWDSPKDEMGVRDVGVAYSLKLIETLRQWVAKISNRDGRLHVIIFSIFDTAAMLCTAIVKDTDRIIPKRTEILAAIGTSVDMLKKLNNISKSSKTSYNILDRLIRRLPDHVPRSDADHRQTKRPRYKTMSPAVQETPSPPPVANSQPAMRQESYQAAPEADVATAPNAGQALSPPAAPYAPAATVNMPMAPLGSHNNVDYGAPSAFDIAPAPGPPLPPVAEHGPHGQHGQHGQPMGHGGPYGLTAFQQMMHPPHAPLGGVASSSASRTSNDQHQWSTTGSESSPPSMDDQMLSSFHAVGQPVPVDYNTVHRDPSAHNPSPDALNGQGVPLDNFESPDLDPPYDPSQDFTLENITQTQLGDLAPLWNWHTENLDFSTLNGPGAPPPNGYTAPS